MVKLLKLIKKKIKTKLLQPLKVITMAQSQYHYIKQIKTVAIFITYIHTLLKKSDYINLMITLSVITFSNSIRCLFLTEVKRPVL